ncbi:MAG: hypothetical protein Q8R79_01750 [Legionellaceae bacterium]|nr:hypothetical protein [Legionellaceae bacterium]
MPDDVLLEIESVTDFNVDLRKYPTAFYAVNPFCKKIVTGDGHSHLMKLLYLPLVFRFIHIAEENYYKILAIYEKQEEYTTEDFNAYDLLIEDIQILDWFAWIFWIGDVVGDRGEHDYFILKLMYEYCKKGAKAKFNIGNHDAELIVAMEQYPHKRKLELTLMHPMFATSLIALARSLENKTLTFPRVFELYQKGYLPSTLFMDCSVNSSGESLSIYTHALVGEKEVGCVAEALNFTFSWENGQFIAHSIAEINERFDCKILQAGQLHKYYNPTCYDEVIQPVVQLTTENIFIFFMWNRNRSFLQRTKEKNGVLLTWVNGHDREECSHENIINLDYDNLLGITLSHSSGIMHSFHTAQLSYRELIAQQAEEESKSAEESSGDDDFFWQDFCSGGPFVSVDVASMKESASVIPKVSSCLLKDKADSSVSGNRIPRAYSSASFFERTKRQRAPEVEQTKHENPQLFRPE